MKALSVRQPWAWFILNSGKDVENRDWRALTSFRGNLLIHASKTITNREYQEACAFALSIGCFKLPSSFESLKLGGIVGMVVVIDHVRQHHSKWFCGPTALVLAKPYPVPFRPCQGALGFFEPAL
jgi:hypothetical protein